MKKLYKIGGLLIIIGLFLFGASKVGTSHSPQPAPARQQQRQSRNQSHTFNVNEFDQIQLKCYRPDIRIATGKKFQIAISGSHGADIKKIKAKVKDQQLTIYDQPDHHYNDGFYQVNISVPKRASLKKVAGFCDAGDMQLTNLDLSTMELKINDGDLVINDAKTNNLQAQVNDGDFKIADSTILASKLKVADGDLAIANSKLQTATKLADGDIKIRSSEFTNDSSFKLYDGEFLMTDSPKISYVLSTSSDENIRFFNKYYSGRFSQKVKNKPALHVNSTDGSILIH